MPMRDGHKDRLLLLWPAPMHVGCVLTLGDRTGILVFSLAEPKMTTILLAHAGTDDRHLYAEYLRAFGFGVREAATTDAALSELGDCQLLITGLLVPGLIDGVELIRRTRARDAALPIVVVTACDVERIHEAARSAGCNELLLKPCFPEHLIESVWRLLDTPHEDRRILVQAQR
jgi:CheY-like chemotaxis protein